MSIDELVKNFLEIRNQAHLWHWQTEGYAEHKALNEFYDGWLDLADDFVETYAGKYGRPKMGTSCATMPYSDGCALPYMNKVADFMLSEAVRSIAPDSDLQNILDEMTSLAKHTAYLLTLK